MQDPLHWMSLRYKLALMFVGVCLLAFGVGGYLVSASAREALEGEIRTRLEFQARAYATALDGELRALRGRLEDFASDGYIRGHVSDLEAGRGQREPLLAELLRHLQVNKLPLVDSFEALRVIDPDGNVVIDTLAGRAPGLLAVERGATTRCGPLVAGAGTGAATHLTLSTPLAHLDGQATLGHLCADVRVAPWVAHALSGEPSTRTAAPVELRLVDERGSVLHVDAARAARDLEDAPTDRGLELVEPGSAPRASGAQDPGVLVRSFPMASNGWRAEVALPAADALAAVAGLQSRFLAFGAALALAAAVLLYFPLRFLTRSLGTLRDAAARIQRADFATRVEVTTADELGEVAQAFNLMAAAVEERSRSTEAAAAALRAESERLGTVIASMRDGLIVLDADGRPMLHNRAAEPLLRLMQRSGVATSHHRCLEGERDGTSCKACLFDVTATPRSCVIEIEGGVHEVRSAHFVADGRGRTGRVLVSRNVTDRLTQDEREIHQERLSVLGEVAAVMAHELNNPLAAISMYNQMLASELAASSALRENVDVIQRNVDTCKRAIRELLDYAGNASPEIHEVGLDATLEDVATFLRPVRQRAGVELQSELGAGDALVRGDEVQLRQIFVNLVLNAVQACAGRPGRVTLRSAVDDGHVTVDVIDNGQGIAPEIQGRIFKPFFSTKRRGEGTGLGLSTARRIAEMHGGSVELVQSSPAGTTFRVRLWRSQGVER